jgi:hypothetical protein
MSVFFLYSQKPAQVLTYSKCSINASYTELSGASDPTLALSAACPFSSPPILKLFAWISWSYSSTLDTTAIFVTHVATRGSKYTFKHVDGPVIQMFVTQKLIDVKLLNKVECPNVKACPLFFLIRRNFVGHGFLGTISHKCNSLLNCFLPERPVIYRQVILLSF